MACDSLLNILTGMDGRVSLIKKLPTIRPYAVPITRADAVNLDVPSEEDNMSLADF